MRIDRWTTASAALLLVIIGFSDAWWPLRSVAVALSLLGLLVPETRDRSWLWFGITAALGGAYLFEWWATDNHHLVILLACMLAGLAVGTADTESNFAMGARLLVAATFGAAIIAKLLSGDFTSGVFGELFFVFDHRLGDLAVRAGALDAADRVANDAALRDLEVNNVINLQSVDGWFAAGFTIWTIAIELLIVVGFLIPRSRRFALVGDVALLVFIATTYTVVPVVGFAGVLSTLGLAQAETTWTKRLFLIALVAIPLQSAASRLI